MAVNNSGKCLLFQLLNMWVHGVRAVLTCASGIILKV